MKILFLLFFFSSCVNVSNHEGSTSIGPRRLVVSGTASVSRAPDQVSVRLSIETIDAVAQAAQRSNAQITETILQGLRERFELSSAQIQTQGYTVGPRYRYHQQTRTLEGFEVRNTLAVNLTKLTDLGALLDFVGEKGAMIQSVHMGIKDSRALTTEALRLALIEARTRAQAIAAESGRKLGGVQEIIEANDVVTHHPRMEMAALGSARSAPSTPIEAGELEISGRVQVSFELL
jgi:uncharacterized protein